MISNYGICLIVLSAILLYLGLYMLVGKIPEKLRGSNYEISRHLMGSAFVMIALSIVIYFATDIVNIRAHHVIALNISFYFTALNLFTASFVKLIGGDVKDAIFRHRFSYITISLFPYLVWATLLIYDRQIVAVAQSIEGFILFMSVLMGIKTFFNERNKIIVNEEITNSEGAVVHTKWMIYCVYNLAAVGVIAGLLASISSFISQWVLFAFLCYFVGVVMYIFNKFIQFMTSFREFEDKRIEEEAIAILETEMVSETENRTNISAETKQYILNQLTQWLERKEYCQKKVNLISTANALSTNRLYLSNYINTTYNCSFRIWLSQLRISEAKRLFLESSDYSISDVADRVGYLSLTSFNHAFNSVEGVSPKQWLASNVENK